MNVYLIGCGGVGAWIAQALGKTLGAEDTLVLVDRDVLEKRNLDRQIFDSSQIGSPKCNALADAIEPTKCKVQSKCLYLGESGADEELDIPERSYIIVGTDNHPARAYALALADKTDSCCIIAANEYEDAEAYFYTPVWRDSGSDPRKYYPEILTDRTDDPLSPPCTGEAQEAAPQLAIANMNAASYAMWLFWFWTQHAKNVTEKEAQLMVPVHIRNSVSRMMPTTLGELLNAS